MNPSVYPATLPCPRTAPFVPADRVRRSDIAGLMQFLGVERDFRGVQDVAFVLTPTKAAEWDTWWRDVLLNGGLWFLATWPLTSGWSTPASRRFIGTPRWRRLSGGNWEVQAQVEVRGASLAPQLPLSVAFLDRFEGTPGDPVDTHTPDIAPSGWAGYELSSGLMMVLTSPNGGISSGGTDALMLAAGFSLTLTERFAAELHVIAQETSNQREYNGFRFNNSSNDSGFDLYIGPDSDNTYKAVVRVGQVNTYELDVSHIISVGEHSIRAEFDLSGATGVVQIYVDGAFASTETFTLDTMPDSFDELLVNAASDGSRRGVVQSIEVATE